MKKFLVEIKMFINLQPKNCNYALPLFSTLIREDCFN